LWLIFFFFLACMWPLEYAGIHVGTMWVGIEEDCGLQAR
jgi:hypothetical protein